MAEPTVTLEAPRLLNQGADIAVRAVFSTPADLSGEPATPTPSDTAFIVRDPDGQVRRFTTPTIKVLDGGLQLSVRATKYGDWTVRVEGTVLYHGQRVLVAKEVLTHVVPSPFS